MSPLPRKEEGSLALAKRGLAGVSIGDSQLGAAPGSHGIFPG